MPAETMPIAWWILEYFVTPSATHAGGNDAFLVVNADKRNT